MRKKARQGKAEMQGRLSKQRLTFKKLKKTKEILFIYVLCDLVYKGKKAKIRPKINFILFFKSFYLLKKGGERRSRVGGDCPGSMALCCVQESPHYIFFRNFYRGKMALGSIQHVVAGCAGSGEIVRNQIFSKGGSAKFAKIYMLQERE